MQAAVASSRVPPVPSAPIQASSLHQPPSTPPNAIPVPAPARARTPARAPAACTWPLLPVRESTHPVDLPPHITATLDEFLADAQALPVNRLSRLPATLQASIGEFLGARDMLQLGATSWHHLGALRATAGMQPVLQAGAAVAWGQRREARYQVALAHANEGRAALERARQQLQEIGLGESRTTTSARICFAFTLYLKLSRSERALIPHLERLSNDGYNLAWRMFHTKPAYGATYRDNLLRAVADHDGATTRALPGSS